MSDPLARLRALQGADLPVHGGRTLAYVYDSGDPEVDRIARETGVARQLAGSQPSGDGSLSVHLEQVPFDALAGWAGALVQRYGVHIASASVESGTAGGLVNATFVLRDH